MGLGDSTFLAHHDDGLSLWSFTSFDLDGFDTIKLFDRRTDERFTAGSSDTSEGGLVFDVSTICDAPQHNRQKGDEVMYFHCSRTDGFFHPGVCYVENFKSQSYVRLRAPALMYSYIANNEAVTTL